MANVVAPPYDVIDQAARSELLGSSGYNAAHLILNPAGHDAAARLYKSWMKTGVLVREDSPSFYLYSQEFECNGPKRRVGLIGALHLEPFSRRVVLPHERTFAHHKDDRLELTKRVETNLSPVFGLYSNPEFCPHPDGGWGEAAEVDIEVAGVRHRLWSLRSAAQIDAVQEALAGRRVFIANGHHRYETALNYYAYTHDGAEPPEGEWAPDDDEQPSAHVMAFLAAFEDPGMVILPTHRELLEAPGADLERFVAALEEGFSVERFAIDAGGRRAFLAALEAAGAEGRVAVGVALAGSEEFFLVVPDSEPLSDSPLQTVDVRVLHADILDGALRSAGAESIELGYTVERDALLARVAAGASVGAFLLNPTRSQQLAEVCEAGELMPQKSTYFYPKLLTGLVFHSLS